MKFVYTLVIKAYSLVVRIASTFNSRAREWVSGRKHLVEEIEKRVAPGEKRIWFHCASLGEFEQGRPVIEAYRLNYPEIKIVLTFFSPSGYNIRKNYVGADYVFYLPADTPRNARRFIEVVAPVAAVFVKYEFWYNYLEVLHRRGTPSILISGIFRPKQHFFRWYGGFFRKMFGFFDHFFVQNQGSAELLRGLGFSNITVAGDTRFDRVIEVVKKAEQLPVIERFTGDSKIMVAGSTWPQDEDILARYFHEHAGQMRLIIAPHEVDRKNIDRIATLFGARAIRLSDFKEGVENTYSILIIDKIGILSSVYRYSHLCLIGGGFGKGIHNILEAATWGKPVLFGPNYSKFREAVDLIALGGAFTFNSYEQFVTIVDNLLVGEGSYDRTNKVCKTYISDNEGATAKIVAYLAKHQGIREA